LQQYDDPPDVRRVRRDTPHAAFLRSQGAFVPPPRGTARLFTRRDRARLKLILRGKRFGFSLEEIRQLLDLYYVGDQQATQLEATLDVARDGSSEMERKRDELTAAVDDLRQQMKMVEDMLSTTGTVKDAAE
jgi:DNA-binding transcriptional MerR regulator